VTLTEAPLAPSRHRRNWLLFTRFGLVGATGVLVNMVVLVVVKRLGPHPETGLLALWPTHFDLRWYHAYSTAAFLVANLWNFQLNRSWTFRSAGHARWWREYWPFLTTGLVGQAIGLLMLTALMHRSSPLSLPTDLLDDSTGFRTRLYWAQLVVIAVVTPFSFVVNKLWAFAAVRSHHLTAVPIHPVALEEAVHELESADAPPAQHDGGRRPQDR
jgi:putative flippase GtrA